MLEITTALLCSFVPIVRVSNAACVHRHASVVVTFFCCFLFQYSHVCVQIVDITQQLVETAACLGKVVQSHQSVSPCYRERCSITINFVLSNIIISVHYDEVPVL